jgi:hypothetical protein
MDGERTQHNRGSVREFRKGGEINPSLPDLHHWSFTLALVTLIGTLPLVRFPRPRTILDEMVRTPAIETAIIAAFWWSLLYIWPCAKLL